MNKLIASVAIVSIYASLCGCADTAPEQKDQRMVVQDHEYDTGSNIARRKNAGANVVSMTVEQAEEMRRSAQQRAPGAGGK